MKSLHLPLRAAAIADLSSVYHPEWGFLASGAGRFTAYFGRDAMKSIVLSLSKPQNGQVPQLLEAAIVSQRTAISRQGKEHNPFTEEASGKKPHEFHDSTSPQDRLARMRENGWPVYEHSDGSLGMVYYGSGDSTPLFTISVAVVSRAIGEKSRRNRDEYIRKMWPYIEAGLHHDIVIADVDNDGLIESAPHNTQALLNHTWKDSNDAYRKEDGSIPEPPYKYLNNNCYFLWSLREAAWMSAVMQNHDVAHDLRMRYRKGREKMHDLFWMEKEQYFAPLIDGKGKQVKFIGDDVLDGLWAGVFYLEHAAKVIARLRQPDMNTCRGLRTRSSYSKQFRINGPRAYHNGLIWLHRNRIAAEGLEQYGEHEFAMEIDRNIAKLESRHGRIECVAVDRKGKLRHYKEKGVAMACKPQLWAVHGTLARTAFYV